MDARQAIMEAYDRDTLKKIADYGCKSGVCHEHIYYGDTVKFFEEYKDEILEHITYAYDTEFLVDLFRNANADFTAYKNDVVWCFIEMIAFEYTESLLQPV